MSRGPGRIERAILALIPTVEPALTVEELCIRIYHLADRTQIEHKHRVNILRSGRRIIERGGNYDWYPRYGSSSRRGESKFLFSLDCFEGYVKAKVKSDYWYKWSTQEVIERDSQPGHRLWLSFEILKAERAQDQQRVAELKAQLDALRHYDDEDDEEDEGISADL